MIELEAFSVEGLRSLVETEPIPLASPTILTGANDGGKSTTLLALAFLLGEWRPQDADFSRLAGTEGGNDALSVQELVVQGQFRLSEPDDVTFDAGTMTLRRRVRPQSAPELEALVQEPADADLRGLDARKLPALKALAAERGIEPAGPAYRRDSWLDPLRAAAEACDTLPAWVPAPKGIEPRLPRLLRFSSTDEPDAEGQILEALRSVYKELLTDDALTGPVREAETLVQDQLQAHAAELCSHVATRCPELSQITVHPEVRFAEGFRRVDVLAGRPGGAQHPLNQTGAGRRRRINLAIWEWAADLPATLKEHPRATVIAYDEPDTHLDYGHQRELVDLMREQCDRADVRMIVATHSLNLIDRVPIENVVHLRIAEQHTRVQRLLTDDHQAVSRQGIRTFWRVEGGVIEASRGASWGSAR